MQLIILLVSLLASIAFGAEKVPEINSDDAGAKNLKNPKSGQYPQPGGGGGSSSGGYPQPGGGGGSSSGGYPQPGGGGGSSSGGYPQPGGGGGGGGYPSEPGYPGESQGGQCQDRRWCENIVSRECALRQDLWAKCPNVCNTCKCYDLDPNCYRLLNRCSDPTTGYQCRRSCQFCTKYSGGQGGQGGPGQYPKSN